MVDITIYGKSSSLYEFMKQVIHSTVEAADIDLNLKEVKDVQQFINRDIMSIPAYQLNGGIIERGDQEFSQFIKGMQIEILKKENYGSMNVINIPIDYSKSAENAIHFASELAKKYNSILKLVHVYHPSPVLERDTITLPELYEAQVKDLHSYTDSIVKNDDDLTNQIIDKELKVGFASDVIKSISEEDADNWIVMSSTNSSKRIKNIFGSISISTAKNSSCPVFIIPPTVKFKPFSKIAMCINDGDIASFSELCKIARPFNSEIHLINIYEPDVLIDSDDVSNEIKSMYPEGKAKFYTLHAKDKINAVNDYCKNNDIDLLVLTRNKRSVLQELFHQSFTKKILLNTELPILVLHK